MKTGPFGVLFFPFALLFPVFTMEFCLWRMGCDVRCVTQKSWNSAGPWQLKLEKNDSKPPWLGGLSLSGCNRAWGWKFPWGQGGIGVWLGSRVKPQWISLDNALKNVPKSLRLPRTDPESSLAFSLPWFPLLSPLLPGRLSPIQLPSQDFPILPVHA